MWSACELRCSAHDKDGRLQNRYKFKKKKTKLTQLWRWLQGIKRARTSRENTRSCESPTATMANAPVGRNVRTDVVGRRRHNHKHVFKVRTLIRHSCLASTFDVNRKAWRLYMAWNAWRQNNLATRRQTHGGLELCSIVSGGKLSRFWGQSRLHVDREVTGPCGGQCAWIQREVVMNTTTNNKINAKFVKLDARWWCQEDSEACRSENQRQKQRREWKK